MSDSDPKKRQSSCSNGSTIGVVVARYRELHIAAIGRGNGFRSITDRCTPFVNALNWLTSFTGYLSLSPVCVEWH